jgi:hypothetical protein
MDMRDHAVGARRRRGALLILCVLGVLSGEWTVTGPTVRAQMFDPRQMSGIPRPDSAQPAHSVSVRLIRGQISNNLTNHPVELLVDGRSQTANTDNEGRAQFYNLPSGASLKAVATVDGERLESEVFPAPGPGQPGIRVILVATDKAGEGERPATPAVTGELRIGGNSRIIVEPDDEIVRVFYLIDIVNPGSGPVNPPSLFMFDTPGEAGQSTTVMEGSTPQASATGTRIRVQGPFPPGETFVQVGYVLPATTGSVEVEQAFPAALDRLAVMVKDTGGTRLASPLIDRQQTMPAGSDNYIVGVGDRSVPAGQLISLQISGLPHHSRTPRWIALGMAGAIVLVGVALAWRPADPETRASARKQLLAKREKLFQDLVRLETDLRRGKGDPARQRDRREAILSELENVYGELETDDPGPEPASRAGRAA